MNEITTKDNYKLIQHEENKGLLIYKDGQLIKRVEVKRPLKEREALDIFSFFKEQTADLEGGEKE